MMGVGGRFGLGTGMDRRGVFVCCGIGDGEDGVLARMGCWFHG